MAKTQKELAFLRDLYVQEEWTTRFTDLVDKHLDLRDAENLLYLNAGTGTHALALYERFGEKADVFAAVENADELTIAADKGAAIKSGVEFSTIRFENDAFDAVLADGSLIRPADIQSFVEDAVRVARVGGDVAVFFPGTGSFGEIFSMLWEVLFIEDLAEHGAAAEQLIADLPTVSAVESMAKDAGMVNVRVEVANESLDFDNGQAFISSPLISDFLLPGWLEMLDEDEKERVSQKLAQLIDDEDDNLSFRFSVKINLLTGEKG